MRKILTTLGLAGLAGLVTIASGCGVKSVSNGAGVRDTVNKAPEVTLMEDNAMETPIPPYENPHLANQHDLDGVVKLTMFQDDLTLGNVKFKAEAVDSDGPGELEIKAIRSQNNENINFEKTKETKMAEALNNGNNRLTNNVSYTLTTDGRASIGERFLGTIVASDGLFEERVGLVGIIQPGSKNELPYTLGDGVCDFELGEDKRSPDCFIQCEKDKDCQTNGLPNEPYCSLDNKDLLQDTAICREEGTLASYCDVGTSVTSCNDDCFEGACLPEDIPTNGDVPINGDSENIRCRINADCDDKNPLTKDLCHGPGYSTSFCANTQTRPDPTDEELTELYKDSYTEIRNSAGNSVSSVNPHTAYTLVLNAPTQLRDAFGASWRPKPVLEESGTVDNCIGVSFNGNVSYSAVDEDRVEYLTNFEANRSSGCAKAEHGKVSYNFETDIDGNGISDLIGQRFPVN